MQQSGLFTSAPIAQAPVARATVEDAALLSAAGFAAGSVSALSACAWAAGYPLKPVLAAWGKAAAWAVSGHVIWPEQGPVVSHWLMLHFGWDALIPAAVAGYWLAYMGWKAGYKIIKPGVLESGYHLTEFADAKSLLNDEIKGEGEGLWLSKNMQAGHERLLRSLFIFGSPGGGKTVFIQFLLKQMWSSKWKTLIIDGPKLDFTPITPDAIVIGVTYDGYAIDLSKDIPDRPSAVEFAAGLIAADPTQPIFGEGARMFLVTIICYLQDRQERYGTTWGWRDLKQHLFLTIGQVAELAK